MLATASSKTPRKHLCSLSLFPSAAPITKQRLLPSRTFSISTRKKKKKKNISVFAFYQDVCLRNHRQNCIVKAEKGSHLQEKQNIPQNTTRMGNHPGKFRTSFDSSDDSSDDGGGTSTEGSNTMHSNMLRHRNKDVFKKFKVVQVLGNGSMGGFFVH
jgi:hypothetical protein